MTTKQRSVIQTQDGLDVIELKMIITNTGDGLSQAMEIEPVVYTHGEKVYVVLETHVAKVRFDEIVDDNDETGRAPDLRRIQILKAGVATVVEAELVEAVVEMQRVKNEERDEELRIEKERAKGIQRLPTDTPSEEEIAAQAARETDADWENSVRNTLDGPTPIGDLVKGATKSGGKS